MADKEGGRARLGRGILELSVSGMRVRAIVERINGEHPEQGNRRIQDSFNSRAKED